MEVGKEISHKIRSAIKAKLVDLGAYVDDELPDYIMVMVANKRTAEQMSSDLSLFLGANNTKFTNWLSGLLEKIQSISDEDAESAPRQQSVPGQPAASRQQPEPQSASRQQSAPRQQSVPRQQELQRASVDKVTKSDRVDSVPEDTIKLAPDNLEEFDEDENLSKPTKPASKSSKPSTNSLAAARKPSPIRISAHQSAAQNKPTSRVRPGTSRSSHTDERKSDSNRKRKMGSAVGAVLKHDVYDDEEYDPHRPGMGVASVVRITDRKSSVPPKLQASKSLLLKAMSEAESSVEPAAKKPAVEKVKPMIQRSSRDIGRGDSDRRPSSSRHNRRAADQKRLPLKDRLGSRRSEPQHLVSRSRREEVKRKVTSEEMKNNESEALKRRAGEEQDVFDEGDILDLTVNDDLDLQEDIDDSKQQGAAPDVLYQSGAEDSDFTDGEGTAGQDTRQFELKSPALPRKKAPSPKFVVTLDQVDPEILEKMYASDDEVIQLDTGVSDMDESLLAGGPDLIKTTGKTTPVVINEDSPTTCGSVEEEVSFNFASDNEDEEMSEKADSLPEKCRFYPSCRNADSCPYYHPTEECRKFPHCRFGVKCLYIHPKCKFDVACTRPTCPFSHTSRRSRPYAPPIPPTVIVQPIKVPIFGSSRPLRPSAPRPLHPSQITCKFFPKCTNMECPFDHPTPCRFGISCNSKATCKFLHPDLPTRGQLKWKSGYSAMMNSDSQQLDTAFPAS